MKSGSMSSYRAALSGTGADFGGERDDEPDDPYCPSCGAYTRSGLTCEDCMLKDTVPDVCHCGLPAEDHKLGGAAEHNFIPKGETMSELSDIEADVKATREPDRSEESRLRARIAELER